MTLRFSLAAANGKTQPPWLGFGMVVRGAKSANKVIRSRGLQKFAHAPHVVRDPGCHRGRHPKRFVDAPEVIPAVPEHHGSAMVTEALRESERQPCEALHAKSERKIRPLHMADADAVRVGATANWDYLRTHHLSGRIPAFAFGRGSVDL